MVLLKSPNLSELKICLRGTVHAQHWDQKGKGFMYNFLLFKLLLEMKH